MPLSITSGPQLKLQGGENVHASYIGSMAYYGDPPWHGLGTSIPQRANAQEMIHAAELDWKVEMRPIPKVGADASEKAHRFQLLRMPRTPFESEVPLGLECKVPPASEL